MVRHTQVSLLDDGVCLHSMLQDDSRPVGDLCSLERQTDIESTNNHLNRVKMAQSFGSGM